MDSACGIAGCRVRTYQCFVSGSATCLGRAPPLPHICTGQPSAFGPMAGGGKSKFLLVFDALSAFYAPIVLEKAANYSLTLNVLNLSPQLTCHVEHCSRLPVSFLVAPISFALSHTTVYTTKLSVVCTESSENK